MKKKEKESNSLLNIDLQERTNESLVTESKKRASELIIANKELAFQNEEKEKRAAELIIANKELIHQNEEKEKRAAELIIANKELIHQNEEKEKRAAELIIANKELAYQNKEKEKRAAELIIANKELAFQNEEKEKRAAELIIANKELIHQNEEKEKRATELTTANAYLDNLIGYANAPIIVLDSQRCITCFNHAFESLTGRLSADVLGQTIDILFPSGQIEKLMELIKKSQAGEHWKTVEIEILHIDGTIHTVLWNSATIFTSDGKTPVATIAQGQEITERIRAEESLKESEARYRTLIENIPQKIFKKDRNYRYVVVNENFSHDIGLHPEDFVGKTDYDFFPGELADKYRADDNRIMETGETEELEEKYLLDGRETWVNTIKTPVRDNNGEIIGVLGIFWDITERKHVEEELQHVNRDLKTLLYIASHDLREPLRSIQNFSQMVNERYADRLDDKGKDFLRRVVKGAERLDRLLNDVLELSRAQHMETPNEGVNTRKIVNEALKRLESKIKETKAKVVVEPNLPTLHVNATWVTQAIYNMVANAIKFTSADEQPLIEIGIYNDDYQTGLVVRDRGTGVAPEHAERIFQLFQRAVGREVDGTGAGLAIVHQVAERHGGRAWVQPREGGGSEFIITFKK